MGAGFMRQAHRGAFANGAQLPLRFIGDERKRRQSHRVFRRLKADGLTQDSDDHVQGSAIPIRMRVGALMLAAGLASAMGADHVHQGYDLVHVRQPQEIRVPFAIRGLRVRCLGCVMPEDEACHPAPPVADTLLAATVGDGTSKAAACVASFAREFALTTWFGLQAAVIRKPRSSI